MKIISATWHNHPILSDFSLNFSKRDGTPYQTIVIAGENGTGKTAILSSLADFCNFKPDKTIQEVKFQAGVGKITLSPTFFDSGTPKGVVATYEDGRTDKWDCARGPNYNHIGEFADDPRNDGLAYSAAEAIYKVQKTDTIKGDSVDQYDLKKESNSVSPQALKQLLINIYFQDGNDYLNRGERNPGDSNTFDSFLPNSRIYRFKNAFNTFFDGHLRYNRVVNSNGQYDIVFQNNGNDISIESLSTGESQIVFRGGSLLKDLNNIQEGVIFIDEPEISMHPSWQKKILAYYKSLFTSGGQQTAQLIIATHSEAVIAQALNDPDTLILILRKNPAGNIVRAENVQPMRLPTPTAAEINYLAFDDISTDYHIALYAYIQELCRRDMHYNHVTVSNADSWIAGRQAYDPAQHEKPDNFRYTDNGGGHHSISYRTLPTYIRNKIDHPDPANPNPYTPEELKRSVELMREIIRNRAPRI